MVNRGGKLKVGGFGKLRAGGKVGGFESEGCARKPFFINDLVNRWR